MHTSFKATGPNQGYSLHNKSASYTTKEVVYVVVCAFLFLAALTIWLASRQIQASVSFEAPLKSSDIALPATQAPEEPPVKAQVTEDQTQEQLEEVIEEWIAANPGKGWSVVVKGLGEDDASASVAADKLFETASIYKLLITYPLLQKVPLEKHDKYTITVNGVPRLISNCVDLMLRVTDNPCGEALADFVGRDNADKALHAAGYKATNLYRSEYMVTTAGDTANFLADLYVGNLLDAEERDYILSSLKRQQVTVGIPRGCVDCVVMNKTGDWNGVRHDVAIVEHAGGAYVIAIFSEGGSYAQIAELSAQVYNFITQER